jgi:hypothetical protein
MYQQIPNHPISGQPTQVIKRLSDSAVIPFDQQNQDYQKYLEWLSEGNNSLPADETTQ